MQTLLPLSQVLLPKIGESIHSATIVRWLKSVGDEVAIDEPLVEVSTDKVNSEIPSPFQGILHEIFAQIGSEVDVGAPLCCIGDGTPQQKQPAAECEYQYISPAVARLIKEYAITQKELEIIPPTGMGGRISKKDVELFLQNRQTQKQIEPPSEITEDLQLLPISPLRKKIGDNLLLSYQTIPHASLLCEIDLTNLKNRFAREKKELEEQGVKLTLTTYVLQAVAHALHEYPLIHAKLLENAFELRSEIHIGIAVSVEEGLFIPVMKNMYGKSIKTIASDLTKISQKARASALTPSDIQGASFTITNFGMTGITIGIPIIPPGQTAILAIGAIEKKVCPIEGGIGIREKMMVNLTFDHRIFDGMYGCAFLNEIKKRLEDQ